MAVQNDAIEAKRWYVMCIIIMHGHDSVNHISGLFYMPAYVVLRVWAQSLYSYGAMHVYSCIQVCLVH